MNDVVLFKYIKNVEEKEKVERGPRGRQQMKCGKSKMGSLSTVRSWRVLSQC
jgi:hypothetical protein